MRKIETPEERLAFDVAFALRRSPYRLKRQDTDYQLVAEKIVQHLQLCGWRLVKKPSTPVH